MPSLDAASAADLFRRPPDSWIDVGAGEVAYRRVGVGPDVVFVHGWPVSSATFRRLLPHLAPHVTCHLFDFPGAGDSRFDAATPLSIERHVHTVRAVVDRLSLDSFVAVGHDSGGLIARHAFADDSRLRGLGLLNTEQSGGLSLPFRAILASRRLPGLGYVLGRAAVLPPRLRRLGLALGEPFAADPTLEAEFVEFFLRPLQQDPRRRAAAARLLRGFDFGYLRDLASLHGRIRVPVHLVWGDRDPFLPMKWTVPMVATFPDARLTVVRGAKLFVHEERPQEVATALLPLLTGQVSARLE